MQKSDLIVMWGGNPVNTQVNVMTHAMMARKNRGAKIACVDIYDTGTMKQADVKMLIRPGTDGALACAVMHVLFRDGYADWAYLEKFTDAPKEFAAHLKAKTPEWASKICDIPVADIEAFAVAETKKAGRTFYHSLVVARKDSGIQTVADLKGKTFAFVDPSSTSGHLFPKAGLIKAGFNPDKDFGRVIFSGSHDSNAVAVQNGKVDAVAIADRILDAAINKGLTKRYGDFDALKGIDLDVAPGEFLVVLGPSGAGKSTLLRCINRLCEPTQGDIHVDGQRVTAERASLRRARRQVAMIFQHYNVVPRLSVLKNVLTGRLGAMPSVASWLQLFPRRDIEIARECLRRVELEEKAELRTDTLSGGQKQRVGIARALAMEPKVLLLDEPMAGMNVEEKQDMCRFILDVNDEFGTTIVLIEHDMGVVMDISDRVVVLDYGKKIGDGTPEEVRGNEEVIRAYLGTSH